MNYFHIFERLHSNNFRMEIRKNRSMCVNTIYICKFISAEDLWNAYLIFLFLLLVIRRIFFCRFGFAIRSTAQRCVLSRFRPIKMHSLFFTSFLYALLKGFFNEIMVALLKWTSRRNYEKISDWYYYQFERW